MKKRIILTSVIAALTAGLTSCNMDLRPYGTIEPDNALQTIDDASRLRLGLYYFFRAYSGGVFVNRDEIRSDLYHATAGFGNNGGNVYNFILSAQDEEPSSIWGGAYQTISNANFFIEKADAVNTEEWSQADRERLNVWKGEAYFLRAYYYMELVKYFCGSDLSSYGVPYVTLYIPTSNRGDYPSRGTLETTYQNIASDLDSARKYVTTAGSVGSAYITADAVTALKARFALMSGDYSTAITEASSLIDSGRYPLVSDVDAFTEMWVNDSGAECILQLDASYPNELGTSYDMGYIGYNSAQQIYNPSYVPEKWVIELFDPTDIRYQVHFRQQTTQGSGGANYDLVLFYKFPGNPSLRGGESDQNYQHKPKVLRIAEMYLIRAEAMMRAGTGDPMADINALRTARIPGYTGSASSDVQTEILNERVRELIGEGFRMQDLRRFGVDLQRRAAQNSASIYLPGTNEDFYVSYQDGRMIFPIPQSELDANPQMAGQQNPGY